MKKINRRQDTTYGETKSKQIKQDPKLVSAELYEIKHIAAAFGCSVSVVRAIRKVFGISRKKVYAELKKRGYVRKSKTK